MSETLHQIPSKLDASERADYISGNGPQGLSQPVDRMNGSPPEIGILDSLMTTAHQRLLAGEWSDRTSSDRWLSPRVHFALRLFRGEAAERGLWQWVGLRYPWYVEWRWADRDGCVANDRWWGPIHKQALARLWWGAELFRDGSDYRPVERAFVFQDLPNSYLHRPVARCRSLALAIVDRFGESDSTSAKQVNSLARVLNLATVGSPPEVETGYQNDDLRAYHAWVSEPFEQPAGWDPLPLGPEASDTTDDSRAGGARIVERGWGYADMK
ncbi:hypothetical protein Mspyr1_08660 [Mycolicibacterium gilvum Spyr1]|uniref:Uncharacterized protein n=1 Tax=Mycolicibacterium gilvum (strain DSM 45189 / LMG 24558 / Spyr1) TaxID=278137 RepID=E6TDI2_MYCSR|nr:hypothetical protein Mspyr1_08660 [Mycolicibacterium gilvum Spyr1]